MMVRVRRLISVVDLMSRWDLNIAQVLWLVENTPGFPLCLGKWYECDDDCTWVPFVRGVYHLGDIEKWEAQVKSGLQNGSFREHLRSRSRRS